MLTLALSLALALPAHSESSHGPIQWIEDDWATAKTKAITDNKLLAVDVWATWCHTCLAMKNYVFISGEFKQIADQHVWLGMDYDRPKNASFFQKYAINAFPSFMVIDPKTDKVIARWLGSGTTEEMLNFFKNVNSAGDDNFSKGQIALSIQDYKAALPYFEKALKETKDREKRTRVLSGYIEALRKSDKENCAQKNLPYLDQVSNNAQGLDYVMMVSYCADANKDSTKKNDILRALQKRLEAGLKSADLNVSVDDKSAIYATLTSVYKQLKEKEKSTQTTLTRLRMLEEAAAQAPNAKARGTFDAHRMSCYVSLMEYAKAEAMLLQSEKDLTQDFNTPWRLALLYRKQDRFNEGLQAIERALKIGYGPRRVRLFSAKIDLAVGKKDFVLARMTAEEARKEIAAQDPKLIRSYWLNELKAKEELIPKK